MQKTLFSILLVFISLLINRLSAQLPKQQLERSDSLQYIVKGEQNRFFGKFKDALRNRIRRLTQRMRGVLQRIHAHIFHRGFRPYRKL